MKPLHLLLLPALVAMPITTMATVTDTDTPTAVLPADTTAASIETAPATAATTTSATGSTLSTIIQRADPTIKFGGYIVGKYSANDRQSPHSSFDLRFVRLYLNGYCFRDFYYRLQMEVNDAPGTDKGPRVIDAFVEWQRYNEFRVKLGQFKRPFGFENPYSPLDVGLGSFSQISTKLASINDRNGEHKSSGRDMGVQIQGDLLPASDGHAWIHYQVGLFNGQGINHSDKDNHKDLIGGLWISPIKNLSIGGFGWDGTYTNENYSADVADTQSQSVKRVRWGAGIKYESAWTFRAEYMSSVGGIATNSSAPTRSDGWYATLGVPTIKNLKLYGRWDCYRDDKTWSTLKTNWGATANYNFNKNFIFQLNYTRTYDRSASTDRRYNTIDLQVYARF